MEELTIAQFKKLEGIENQEEFDEYIGGLVTESVVPALCEELCEVEPDGMCPHGHPSILIKLGLI